jgi:hypothetical protein
MKPSTTKKKKKKKEKEKSELVQLRWMLQILGMLENASQIS